MLTRMLVGDDSLNTDPPPVPGRGPFEWHGPLESGQGACTERSSNDRPLLNLLQQASARPLALYWTRPGRQKQPRPQAKLAGDEPASCIRQHPNNPIATIMCASAPLCLRFGCISCCEPVRAATQGVGQQRRPPEHCVRDRVLAFKVERECSQPNCWKRRTLAC
jgi:hypothetical protein